LVQQLAELPACDRRFGVDYDGMTILSPPLGFPHLQNPVNAGHTNPQLISHGLFGDLWVFLKEFLNQGSFFFGGGFVALVATCHKIGEKRHFVGRSLKRHHRRIPGLGFMQRHCSIYPESAKHRKAPRISRKQTDSRSNLEAIFSIFSLPRISYRSCYGIRSTWNGLFSLCATRARKWSTSCCRTCRRWDGRTST